MHTVNMSVVNEVTLEIFCNQLIFVVGNEHVLGKVERGHYSKIFNPSLLKKFWFPHPPQHHLDKCFAYYKTQKLLLLSNFLLISKALKGIYSF